ncbi:MAG: Yip1 family protein [Thermomicrobiales bacterium]
MGILKFDEATWRGIKQDPAATKQAWMIVGAAGLLSGIGSARQLAEATIQMRSQFDQMSQSDPALAAQVQEIDFSALNSAGGRVTTILFSIVAAIIAWYIFAALARWAGRQFFGADPNAITNEEMRRMTGWAYAPALLNILAPIPVLGPIISVAAAIWVLINTVLAVKYGQNLSTGKSIGATIVANILPGIFVGLLICICIGIVAATGGVTTTTP